VWLVVVAVVGCCDSGWLVAVVVVAEWQWLLWQCGSGWCGSVAVVGVAVWQWLVWQWFNCVAVWLVVSLRDSGSMAVHAAVLTVCGSVCGSVCGNAWQCASTVAVWQCGSGTAT
jgi:hypothetical protein